MREVKGRPNEAKDAKMSLRNAKEKPREAQERPKGGQGEAKGGQREAKGRPREAKGRPKETKRKPKGGPERPKAGKAAQSLKRTSGYRVLGCQKPSDFGGKMMPKFSQSRKSDFLKTELSFESGAHFQREGQARPGQKGLAKP